MEPGREPLAERYTLEKAIGRGGMSTVYRATDLVLGRTVAVKVLLAALADQDPAYVARFEREARAAAALRHPAVVAVYDVGADADTRFIVMEYVAGRSLASLLRDGKPLPPDRAVYIGEQVASALAAAHAAGIVHRDIKPANVMVSDDGAVKVLDFGIARMLEGTTITQAASVLGTAAYMSPERAEGRPGDARSDVYSLGCLLYAMLTGAPPFGAEHAAALLHQHVNVRPRPVREVRAVVPPALDALISEMLAKDPGDRPQSAEEVRGRLLPAIDPTAPTVPLRPRAATAPTVPVAKASRPVRRWRALVAALAAGAVALLALLLSSGGGGSARQASSVARGTVPTATQSTRTPSPAVRSAPPPAAPAPTAAAPAAAGPPGHDKVPPGHHKPGHGNKHHRPGKGH